MIYKQIQNSIIQIINKMNSNSKPMSNQVSEIILSFVEKINVLCIFLVIVPANKRRAQVRHQEKGILSVGKCKGQLE